MFNKNVNSQSKNKFNNNQYKNKLKKMINN